MKQVITMENQQNFSAYVVIPSYILFDMELPDKAKLLYGLISSMCNHKGYCWATNAVFMRYLGARSTKTPERLIKELKDRGYIQILDGQGGRGITRKIYLTNFLQINLDGNVAVNLLANFSTVNRDINVLANPDRNVAANPDRNVGENNINNNNTPYSPPKGVGKISKRKIDGTVQLTPAQESTFAMFWDAWPKKTDKQKARERWARLNPDKKLLQDILAAIERQKTTRQWQDKQFIPSPAKWLLNRKWEDETDPPTGNQTKSQEVQFLE